MSMREVSDFFSHTFSNFGRDPNFFPYKFLSQGGGVPDLLGTLPGYAHVMYIFNDRILSYVIFPHEMLCITCVSSSSICTLKIYS